MGIKLIQCLCSEARHCIVGMAYDDADISDQEAISGIHECIKLSLDGRGPEELGIPEKLDPWCGICAAPRSLWRYEMVKIRASTIAEANDLLQKGQVEQLGGRAVLDAFGLTYDVFKAAMKRRYN